MSSDYESIKRNNITRFGTDIPRIGKMLLSDRYADRTHFIYELLQNAEDALKRRKEWSGPRSVSFHLTTSALRVSHFGTPFTDRDVSNICGIDESEKDLTSIGRFGIGFKSVFAFTDAPEIHSDDEHFAIDSFVWPRAVAPIPAEPDQTILLLPFRPDDRAAKDEIAVGLRKLGPRVLLFLREIESVQWSIEEAGSGFYLRGHREPLTDNAVKVDLAGEERTNDEQMKDDTEESWVVFSREATKEGAVVGNIELAFALAKSSDKTLEVMPVKDSSLVVFFPTIVKTNLGFLVQGPYRTTPSRDNVPRQDPWNRQLVNETSGVLTDALNSLSKLNSLTVGVLNCLPLDRSKFGEEAMFAPIFEVVANALLDQPLLPRYNGGGIRGRDALLARTQELREVFNPRQLKDGLGSPQEVAWLSADITAERQASLRAYLMQELKVPELTWETILPRLTKSFLQEQSDDWIGSLYSTLNGQPALIRAGRLNDVPLIRLEDQTHVTARGGGTPRAFLPGKVSTGFPVVSPRVLTSPEARSFLEQLGLTEPDPVDDVILNVLPAYLEDGKAVPDGYAADIARLLNAFGTDSKSRQDSLLAAARSAAFVAVVDAGTGQTGLARPGLTYMATHKMKELFQGVAGVLIVNDSYDCLRGERVRLLLEACGTSRFLNTAPVYSKFSPYELAEMRRQAGWAKTSGGDVVIDHTLRGLGPLLEGMGGLDPVAACSRARLLWEALCDLDQRSPDAFEGTYTWWYHQVHECRFDAAFVRMLNKEGWVPTTDSGLRPPSFVSFATIKPAWEANGRLLSRIRFKPPILEALAKEAGLESGLLELLKSLGVTRADQLRDRLGIAEEVGEASGPIASTTVEGPTQDQPESAVETDDNGPPSATGAQSKVDEIPTGRDAGPIGPSGGLDKDDNTREATEPPVGASAPIRTFISYIGVQNEDEGEDPDGLGHQRRLKLEESAILLILNEEPALRRTPLNNPGFDLVENDSASKPKRWVEVKAMRGTLKDRPVGLSQYQFLAAQEHGDRYWLYVVEQAGSRNARILRISNPAGRDSTFTFDSGWIHAAVTEPIEG